MSVYARSEASEARCEALKPAVKTCVLYPDAKPLSTIRVSQRNDVNWIAKSVISYLYYL
jgi:hypothetical protein